MPVNPTYPGLYIEELPPTARTITAAPTSIAVFIGHTHPFRTKEEHWGKAVPVFSFTEYEREFGGLYRNTLLDSHVPYAVQQFFLNGGSIAYIVAVKPFYYPSGVLTPATLMPASKVVVGSGANKVTFTA